MRGVKKKSVVYKKRLLFLQQHYQGLAIAISNLRFFFFLTLMIFQNLQGMIGGHNLYCMTGVFREPYQ